LTNSNTSLDLSIAWLWPLQCLRTFWAIMLAILCFAHAANALDPNQDISHYIRDGWSDEQGYPGGAVYAITQSDGYLWIGTARGLVRFDGLSFSTIQPDNSDILPDGPVLGTDRGLFRQPLDLAPDAQPGLLSRHHVAKDFAGLGATCHRRHRDVPTEGRRRSGFLAGGWSPQLQSRKICAVGCPQAGLELSWLFPWRNRPTAQSGLARETRDFSC
jgi:hypothetical protein